MNFLSGKKTYITATLLLISGLYGGLTGTLDGATALNTILTALAIMGLRSAISKVGA